MKTIIAGSRTINNYEIVEGVIIICPWEITEVVCGCAAGVDTTGEFIAKDRGWPIVKFPAEWEIFGKRAGVMMRNKDMVDYADALILIWDGKNKGSKNMLQTAKKTGLRILEIIIKEYEEK